MTNVQKIIAKLDEFIHQETDGNNPHLEITVEEAKILLDLTY